MNDVHSLELRVARTCNLQCPFCESKRTPTAAIHEADGRQAIDQAIASVSPSGTLEIAFAGGEPLLEAELIERLVRHARSRAAVAGIRLKFRLTTNGTIAHPRAWSIMTLPEMSLTVCCDGLPVVHDRYRRFIGGQGTCATVLATIRRLLAAGKSFRVIMVVRPDTVVLLPLSVEFLKRQGVQELHPALAVPPSWSPADMIRLERALDRCHDLWPRYLVVGSDLISGTPVDLPCESASAETCVMRLEGAAELVSA